MDNLSSGSKGNLRPERWAQFWKLGPCWEKGKERGFGSWWGKAARSGIISVNPEQAHKEWTEAHPNAEYSPNTSNPTMINYVDGKPGVFMDYEIGEEDGATVCHVDFIASKSPGAG